MTGHALSGDGTSFFYPVYQGETLVGTGSASMTTDPWEVRHDSTFLAAGAELEHDTRMRFDEAPAGNVEITVLWRANTYTVTFDKKGGNGGPASVTATYGSAMPTVAVPVKLGCTFGGYYTAANGGGTKYYNADGTGARSWDLAADTTLYAKWVAMSYSVTLNKDGGTVQSGNVTSYVYGTGATLPTAVTRSGYTFLGWYTSAAGGVRVGAIGADATGDKTYYAHWSTESGASAPPAETDGSQALSPAPDVVSVRYGDTFAALHSGGEHNGWLKNFLSAGSNLPNLSVSAYTDWASNTLDYDARIPSDYGVNPSISCNEFGLYDGSITVAARWDMEAAGQWGRLSCVFHSWYHSERSLSLGASSRGFTSTVTTRYFVSMSGRGRALLNSLLTGNGYGHDQGMSFFAGCHVSFHPVTQVWNATLATGWWIQTHGAGLEGD